MPVSSWTRSRCLAFLLAFGLALGPTPTARAAHPLKALDVLKTLPLKGRAPKTGYTRAEFGHAWADEDHNGCDTRDDILRRDLRDIALKPGTHDCVIASGVLTDPYSGDSIAFTRGPHSADVQIDHVVALSNAWQTGAFQWTAPQRQALANDPLNLLAVEGQLNSQKGDGDAATWLPPRKAFRCAYVARQIAVKARHGLLVTPPERDAMVRVLAACPGEPLPVR